MMNKNPLELQVVNNASSHNDKGLWNPKSFYWLGILFSFLPIAILFSLNYGRVGLIKKRNRSLVIAIISFILVVIIGGFIPDSLSKGLYFGLNAGAAVYLRREQQDLYNSHISNGGKKASLLVPVGICSILTGLVLWALIYSYNIPEDKLAYKQSDLYYTENISKEDAQRLGDYLNDNGFFGNRSLSVKIDQDKSGYIFSIPVDKAKLEDQEALNNLRKVSDLLSKEVFSGKQFEIHLTDNRFNNIKTISSETE
jgi:hypothetical protein